MSVVDGVWETVIDTPMGQRKGTLTLKSDGASLSGTLDGDQGSIAIQDGAVNGNDLTWKADISNPMSMTLEFSAKVDGDAIAGSVKLGGFGTASFKGSRAG